MKLITKISPLIKEIELRSNPVVIRVNKFDEESAKKFDEEVSRAHSTGQKVIPIVIDSPGGMVYSLMSMIGTIKHAELPIATIVEGKAMSCGAILTTFGAEGMRFMDPNATIMIHDVSSGDFGKIEELKSSVGEAERLNDIVYKMMAQNCGKKEDYFLKIVDQKKHADWFMGAEEAKKHNIVNQLRVPKFNIEVGVSIEFE